MLLKTKLLLSLCAIGIAGGTGMGIYCIQNIDSIEDSSKQQANLEAGSEGKREVDGNLPESPLSTSGSDTLPKASDAGQQVAPT